MQLGSAISMDKFRFLFLRSDIFFFLIFRRINFCLNPPCFLLRAHTNESYRKLADLWVFAILSFLAVGRHGTLGVRILFQHKFHYVNPCVVDVYSNIFQDVILTKRPAPFHWEKCSLGSNLNHWYKEIYLVNWIFIRFSSNLILRKNNVKEYYNCLPLFF